ncbi:MAG: NADH-quinone oxidoreductase subunit M [Deltaproteobacteria bacterium]|nr:NADH-quinone oxidoreductase subunit M [Deltaproteobacteria bacterium]
MPWLSITVLAPLLAAAILLLVPASSRGTTRVLSAAASLVSLWGAIEVSLAYNLHEGGLQLRETLPLVPSLGINWDLAVDGWGVSLLLLTGLILFAGVFATWTLDDRDKDFYILLLTLVAGVLGVFVSLDLFVFFLFYEIAVLPMYLLIGIWGSTKKIEIKGPFAFALRRLDVGGREYAAMKLTLMLLIGSAFILVGIFALYQGGGARDFGMLHLAEHPLSREAQLWVFPALWLGFGSLAGVFPFHTWSPDGHASAPTAVSMLHAGVLMKLGAFGVMRVGMVLCPEGAVAWAPIVGAVAVINVVYGALGAMSQTDLKYVIAYSSVSHMGVVMLGAATLDTDGWNGAVFQMFAHGLMTGLFFALVGLVYGRAHDREIFRMGGFAKAMPGVAVFFTLAGLSSLGMPGFAGFIAEFLVFLGAWRSGNVVWALAGIVGAWVTAVYVLRAVRAIFWGEGPPERYHHLSDAKGTEWVALVLLGGCLIVFGCWPRLVLDAIDVGTSMHLPVVLQAVKPELAL